MWTYNNLFKILSLLITISLFVTCLMLVNSKLRRRIVCQNAYNAVKFISKVHHSTLPHFKWLVLVKPAAALLAKNYFNAFVTDLYVKVVKQDVAKTNRKCWEDAKWIDSTYRLCNSLINTPIHPHVLRLVIVIKFAPTCSNLVKSSVTTASMGDRYCFAISWPSIKPTALQGATILENLRQTCSMAYL